MNKLIHTTFLLLTFLYIASSQQCDLCCAFNCVPATSAICTSCCSNSYLPYNAFTPNNNNCFCLNGYYRVNNRTCSSCSASMQNCATCTSQVVCDQCVTGYYVVAATRQCAPCGLLCKSCSGSAGCDICPDNAYRSNITLQCVCGDGYSQNEGQCHIKPTTISIALGIFFIISLTIAIVIFQLLRWKSISVKTNKGDAIVDQEAKF